MLAFSCAMLEQYSGGTGPSDRFNAITSFLEESVKVVPIESIFHSIGYSELSTAVECAKALVHANPTIPASIQAKLGAQRAAVRMRTGLHGINFDVIVNDCIKNTRWALFGEVYSAGLIATSRDDLVFSASGPMHYPFRFPQVSYASVTSDGPIQSDVQIKLRLPPEDDANSFDTYPEIASKLEEICKKTKPVNDLVCNLGIEHLYPMNSTRRHSMYVSTLKSPIEVLRNAREEIKSLLECSSENVDSGTEPVMNNEQMLSLVRDVIGHNLKICASLIGGFMEQTIRIPLLKSNEGTAYMLSEASSPVAMGAWALFSLHFGGLQDMLSRLKGNPLLVQIADYISVIGSDEDLRKTPNSTSKYAGKLQFLLQGMRKKTITCSSQYISYSLEHQLCSNLKFNKKITVKDLIKDWDKIFKGDALSLVAGTHRSLVARWLKWTVLVHDLRESLAKYTCIGVTGLVNSGKSHLVKNLFNMQVEILLYMQQVCT